jgi:hypothetical protein
MLFPWRSLVANSLLALMVVLTQRTTFLNLLNVAGVSSGNGVGINGLVIALVLFLLSAVSLALLLLDRWQAAPVSVRMIYWGRSVALFVVLAVVSIGLWRKTGIGSDVGFYLQLMDFDSAATAWQSITRLTFRLDLALGVAQLLLFWASRQRFQTPQQTDS